jgi:hypothetical protein
MVAYFIRRGTNGCSVVKLHPDDSEEVVQSGLPLGEAEDVCVAKIAELPKPVASLSPGLKPCFEQRRPMPGSSRSNSEPGSFPPSAPAVLSR